MTLSEQYDTQLRRAELILREMPAIKHLDLVVVRGEEISPRISVIGHAISPAVIDIWRSTGSTVVLLDRVTR